VVEGYHLPDPQMNPIDLLPKGVEIRTPICDSIEDCLAALKTLHARLQNAVATLGYRAVSLSFHPTEVDFHGPQNKRRHDFWQWAMQAMLTYGPDVNVSLPKTLTRHIDLVDLNQKVNYYIPALTALTLSSPLRNGEPWRIRGRIGKSVRTYHRSATAPAIEIHPDEGLRLELKPFEMSCSLVDYRNYFLLWLALILDDGLKGRASDQTRIYDLGRIACYGVDASAIDFRFRNLSEIKPENPSARFRIAWATPSTKPTMLPFAWSACVRKIGNTGESISVDISANKLPMATRNVFFESPEKQRWIFGWDMDGA
jgi:hypothetical protein